MSRPTEGARPKNKAIPIRTSPDLYQRIVETAAVNGRSMTQEIEHRLIRSFEREDIKDWLDEWARHRTEMPIAAGLRPSDDREPTEEAEALSGAYTASAAHLLCDAIYALHGDIPAMDLDDLTEPPE